MILVNTGQRAKGMDSLTGMITQPKPNQMESLWLLKIDSSIIRRYHGGRLGKNSADAGRSQPASR